MCIFPSAFGEWPLLSLDHMLSLMSSKTTFFPMQNKTSQPLQRNTKKVVFRQTRKKSAALWPSAAPKHNHRSTPGGSMTENLLVENTLTPPLILGQIWAYMFLHYRQIFTEERLNIYSYLTSSWYHQVSTREHQNIPKEDRKTETLHCRWGDALVSLAFVCSSNCGSRLSLLHTFI